MPVGFGIQMLSKQKVDPQSLSLCPVNSTCAIQYRHPAVEMPLQNCFPRDSSPLLRAPPAIESYLLEWGVTAGFELDTCRAAKSEGERENGLSGSS
jgi:hypothetical protein